MKINITKAFLLTAALFAALLLGQNGAFAQVESAPATRPAKAADAAATQAAAEDEKYGDTYPLTTCPVSGGKLGSMGDPILYDHNGRDIRFCCAGCIKKFESEPAAYIQKIDTAIIEQQKKDYPFDVCLVSGEPLAENVDERVYVVANNRLIAVCCAGCKKTVEKSPAKFVKQLDKKVVAQQKPDYPHATCAACPKKLDEATAVDYVHANQLVRFCSDVCATHMNEDPQTWIDKVNKAAGNETKQTDTSEIKTGHEGHNH